MLFFDSLGFVSAWLAAAEVAADSLAKGVFGCWVRWVSFASASDSWVFASASAGSEDSEAFAACWSSSVAVCCGSSGGASGASAAGSGSLVLSSLAGCNAVLWLPSAASSVGAASGCFGAADAVCCGSSGGASGASAAGSLFLSLFAGCNAVLWLPSAASSVGAASGCFGAADAVCCGSSGGASGAFAAGSLFLSSFAGCNAVLWLPSAASSVGAASGCFGAADAVCCGSSGGASGASAAGSLVLSSLAGCNAVLWLPSAASSVGAASGCFGAADAVCCGSSGGASGAFAAGSLFLSSLAGCNAVLWLPSAASSVGAASGCFGAADAVCCGSSGGASGAFAAGSLFLSLFAGCSAVLWFGAAASIVVG